MGNAVTRNRTITVSSQISQVMSLIDCCDRKHYVILVLYFIKIII